MKGENEEGAWDREGGGGGGGEWGDGERRGIFIVKDINR